MRPYIPASGRYGVWAGNEKGDPEDPLYCVAEVYHSTGGVTLQCHRKRGHGPGGKFCKQHAKMASPGGLAQ